jgi:hypothetical protein
MGKCFYCVKCEKVVEAEPEEVIVKDDISRIGYFCGCGYELGKEIDADAEYERWKDMQMDL